MKAKIFGFVLAFAVAGYAQHGGGGHAGGTPSSAGSTGGSMSSGHAQSGNTALASSSRPSDIGQQSPDTILNRDIKLSSKLDTLLPKGETAQQACSGFKNLGQCVAAIHVANNLGISFDDLKAKMTRTNAENLGKVIQDMKPDANAKAEAKKAMKQANQDISESES